MKTRTRSIIATSAILISLGMGVSACSGPDKAAEASASASAQTLQSLDSRATLESFFVMVKADTVSTAKASDGGFKENFAGSLEYVSSEAVSDEQAEKLVSEISAIYTANPTATISVDETKAKLESDKATFSIADLTIYTDEGKIIPAPSGKGSITVSGVDGKPLITAASAD